MVRGVTRLIFMRNITTTPAYNNRFLSVLGEIEWYTEQVKIETSEDELWLANKLYPRCGEAHIKVELSSLGSDTDIDLALNCLDK